MDNMSIVTTKKELNPNENENSFVRVAHSINQLSVSKVNKSTDRQFVRTTGDVQYCVVCGEVANGNFFGAVVCLPCKSFFIRCTRDGELCILQQCDGKCDIKKQLRNRCQFCRYQQCMVVGMSRKEKPECIQPEEGQELCKVCGDLANGIHFGVYTCEGCKKFFRRGLREHHSYVCKDENKCVLNPRNRNSCRFCRYQNCIKVGMSREAIKMGRPRKVFQNSHTDDTRIIMGTSVKCSKDYSSKNNNSVEVSIMSCYDDNREELVKWAFEHKLSGNRHRIIKTFVSRSGEDGLHIQNNPRGSDDSDNFHDWLSSVSVHEPLNTQNYDRCVQFSEVREPYSKEDSCSNSNSKEQLQSLRQQPYLIDNTSLSGTDFVSCSSNVRMHETNITPVAISQTEVSDDFRFSKHSTQMELHRNIAFSENETESMHDTLERRFYATYLSPGVKECLIQRTRSEVTNTQHKTEKEPSDKIDPLEVSACGPLHRSVLSHSPVDNKRVQLSLSRMSALGEPNSRFVCNQKPELIKTNRSNNSFSEVVQYLGSHRHTVSCLQSFPEELPEVPTPRYKRSLEKYEISEEVSDSKVVKYDDLILDLSVNTKLQANVNRNTVMNCSNGASDSQNRNDERNTYHNVQFEKLPNQNVVHSSELQNISGQFGSNDIKQKIKMSRMCSHIPYVAASCEDGKVNYVLDTETDDTCSNNCNHTIENTLQNNTSLLEMKHVTANPDVERRFLARTPYCNHNIHKLAMNCCETGFLKDETNYKSLLVTPLLPSLVSPSLALETYSEYSTAAFNNNNNNINNNNNTTVKLSASSPPLLVLSSVLPTDSSSATKNIQAYSSLLNVPKVSSVTVRDSQSTTSDSDDPIRSCLRNQPRKSVNPYTNEQTIMYINEMFMVVDTLTDTNYHSTQRISCDNISSEMVALDSMFTNVYGYSPLKVARYWKNLHLSIPGGSPEKCRTTLTPAQLGWLSDITKIYDEQVEACDEDINPPTVDTNKYETWPLPGEDIGHWRHFQERLARQTYAEAQFVLRLSDIAKIQPKDHIKLSNNTHLFGNTILMASREWFDPVRKKFKFFWNWKLPQDHPLNPFQTRMIKTGSRIYNLHMDRSEVAILSALNIICSENGTFQNPIQISGHTNTLLNILCHYLYTINVDPEDRFPELLSIMPKVRLMTMWYSNLINNMRADPSSIDKTLQDLTVMAAKMSSGDVIES